ncbi:maleylacetoacetate isomerase [Methylobacterium frigidaeris]|uniref:Maleylpyruvate isomerase n=1 Tax=Methylobacterium frigidaeris TaxID=2038277 RepID=A0AA37HGK1_9HYPH|nr:maleylacetoacetate isomerase [Methylobacterium frigidaeris]PIK74165.1 maleylacetoacetate isomerase [Methylobacterium frigidaeris]GJD65478.1 Maleylpyruvate isomerase [Methylobacterium frigidaeris]
MKLYGYWRSTSSYRLRLALALKGVVPDQVPVHLVRDGGEHRGEAYRRINPQGRVPSLALADGRVLIQSPAIIEYLEEVYPEPPLLPADPVARAQVRAVAAIIGCDIHPLHNVGPLNHLRRDLGRPEEEVGAWIGRWISEGFTAIEALIGDEGYCFGAGPGLADVYLVPQVYAARRFAVPLEPFPRITRASSLAEAHPAFQAAHPSRQPDAE